MGDVIIAADGIHSIGIETILGRVNPPQPQELYNGCYRFLIPAADLDADAETAFWNENGTSNGKMHLHERQDRQPLRLVSVPKVSHMGELFLWLCSG